MLDNVVNIQMVSVTGNDIAVLAPRHRMTKEEALIHAAWLVALADEHDQFSSILEQVQNT